MAVLLLKKKADWLAVIVTGYAFAIAGMKMRLLTQAYQKELAILADA